MAPHSPSLESSRGVSTIVRRTWRPISHPLNGGVREVSFPADAADWGVRPLVAHARFQLRAATSRPTIPLS